jgi:hypothetical protein
VAFQAILPRLTGQMDRVRRHGLDLGFGGKVVEQANYSEDDEEKEKVTLELHIESGVVNKVI